MRSVSRGPIPPLIFDVSVLKFADHPVNYHLYTSENDGPQTTDTVSKSTLTNKDSGQG